MSKPKRHHFVPISYLNGFVDDSTGFLHVYNKHSNEWRNQKPKEVMVRNKYYHQDWAPDGVDKNVLEKKFGAESEPLGLKALNKLVESTDNIDDLDVAHILIYIQLQRIRVPRQAEMAKSLAKTAVTLELMKTLKGQEALKSGKVIIKDSIRFDFMRAIHGTLTPYFSRMTWELVEAAPGSSFITSDSPVSFYNIDFIPPTEAGPGLYGTKVFYPINKRFLLIMQHPEYEAGEKGASDKLPTNLDISDGLIEIRKDAVWDTMDVSKQNWLMYQLSHELIVGDSREILGTAIRSMLKN